MDLLPLQSLAILHLMHRKIFHIPINHTFVASQTSCRGLVGLSDNGFLMAEELNIGDGRGGLKLANSRPDINNSKG